MIAPQNGALGWAGSNRLNQGKGDGRVQHRSNRSGAVAALMLAVALSGCASADVFDQNEHWFSRPFDWTGQSGGYSFSELRETQDRQAPVTNADLVDANGACPPAPSAPMSAAAAQPMTASDAPGAMPVAPSADPLLGQGVALGMTECEVVYRAGAPSAVQLGTGPNGGRTAVLTFNGGPRAGIYRFAGGRLTDMDGIQTAVSAPPPAKKVAVKKKRAPVQAEQVTTQ